jgi:hypothetical protein
MAQTQEDKSGFLDFQAIFTIAIRPTQPATTKLKKVQNFNSVQFPT